MIRRALVVVLVSMATPALAQAISGTLSASFASFDQYGGPTTHVELNLACALSCPASAPELTYGSAFVDGFFAAEAAQTCGSMSYSFISGVRTTGTSVTDTGNFPAGSNFFIKAKSVTCQCGNRTGEGGYIDILSGTVHIPPWISVPSSPPTPGEFYLLMVTAAPRTSETVDVTVRGAGADYSASFPATDFVSTNSVPGAVGKRIDVPFTQAGTVTVTAVVTGGPMATKTFEVVAASASGGGSGSTGGGSGSGGGGGAPESGCTSVPMLLPIAMLLLGLRRKR